jgi:hypothetical protein
MAPANDRDHSVPLQPAVPDEKLHFIELMRRVAKELKSDSVPRAEFKRRSGVSDHKIKLLFGSYNGLVEAAGLVAYEFPIGEGPLYSDDELLAEIIRVLRLPGSKPTSFFFEQHSDRGPTTYHHRFGSWIGTLEAAAAKLDPVGDADLLSRIRAHTARLHQRRRPPRVPGRFATRAAGVGAPAAPVHTVDPPATATPGGTHPDRSDLYGELINFRGLAYAPLNEGGVILLFGMICRDLGYVVDVVRPGFPDCEAKRELRPGLWQRVRIEFEYQSRSFRSHGHDPSQCDLIVCWEHNWPECPLEVLELKAVLPRLAAA